MRRLIPQFLILLVVVVMLVASGRPARALPEYSVQTGDPCASCHISPSGGGLRTPRGQAWVGENRPGVVPSLTDSLELLGVHLDLDPAAYLSRSQEIRAPQPLQVRAGQNGTVHAWLKDYEGN